MKTLMAFFTTFALVLGVASFALADWSTYSGKSVSFDPSGRTTVIIANVASMPMSAPAATVKLTALDSRSLAVIASSGYSGENTNFSQKKEDKAFDQHVRYSCLDVGAKSCVK